MKKLLILLLSVFLTNLMAMAQDQLITEDGDVITAWEVEIASSKIFYKPTKNAEDSKSIAKSKVLMWKKADGTKVRIGEQQTITTTAQSQSSANSATLGYLSQELKEKNEKLVCDFNKHIKIYEKDADEDADNQLYNFWATDGTVFENDEIRVTPHFVCCYSKTSRPEDNVIISTSPQFDNGTMWVSPYKGKGWQVTVYNKTDHNIYIDQANSFFIINGQAISYYTPKSTALGNSASSGVGIGLGIIGIGGSTTNSATETTFTQRLTTIPPMSSKDLDVINLNKDNITLLYTPLFKYLVEQRNMKVRNMMTYYICNIPMQKIETMPSPSPVTLGNVIVYSDNESFKTKGTLKQTFELKECVGIDPYEHNKKEPKSFNSEELQLPLTLGCMNHNFLRTMLKDLKAKQKKMGKD